MTIPQRADKRRLHILLGGEKPVKSAPTVSLARALRSQGIDVEFSHAAESLSTVSWVSAISQCDVILWVGYQGPDLHWVKRLALAVALGHTVIRWWVGSDVLSCLRDPACRARARILASFSARNIAVAPHLAEELSSFGIRAVVVPSVIDLDLGSRRSLPGSSCRDRVLVYLPAARRAFYGEAIVERVIRANPDLTFVIVGDEDHRFGGVANVESLGWVGDMKPVYDRVGCLLRLTEHDGLPRMVLEALLLGKYVIYSGQLPGTWRAKTFEGVQQALERFRASASVNTDGVRAAKGLLTPPPEVAFLREIRDSLPGPGLGKRIRAFLRAIDLTVRARIRRAKHHWLTLANTCD
jgi:hypothetical protein